MASMNTQGQNVPGFDFLQGLMKSAGAAMPGMNTWIAPTLDPEELNKRIEELRTVQFWLEQNAKLIGTSIQALEVQRMTLSTLKSLNVQVKDLSEAMKVKVPAAETGEEPGAQAQRASKPGKSASGPPPVKSPESAGVVDPAQWWGALTQQFSELAAQAMKDSGAAKVAEAAAELPAQALKAARKVTTRSSPAAQAPAKTSRRRKA